ncbi:MAG: hypothetical protein L0H15_04285 [Nitrosospira sp.]|nr:hypothetical protein [Nitrosospira sp.]
MTTANLKFVKRNAASALSALSFIVSITAATDVMSAPFIVGVSIQELLTPTFLNPASHCTSPYEGTITGSGISSLGNVSVEASNCVTPLQNSFAFDDGKMTISLLSGKWSGDEIFADFDGLFTPTGIPSIFAFTDTFFKITGGTGDFQQARGGGEWFGRQDISSGEGFVFATGRISHFKNDGDDDEDDRDDDEDDRDRKKKDRDDDDNDRKERDDDRKKSETDQRIAGSADSLALTDGSSSTITAVGLDSGLFLDGQSPGQTIGELFYQDRDGQLLAINALPETGSLALMGIGLASLVIIRRRKPANSTQ